jgi:hypothetical protein
LKSQRVADGDHQLSHPQRGGIAQLGHRQVAPYRTHDDKIGRGVRAGDLRHQRVAVRQADLDLAGVPNDMMVRGDESIWGKDDTRRCSSRALVLS